MTIIIALYCDRLG